MRNHEITKFKSGAHTRVDSEVIPNDAASDSLNWITTDGHIELVRGKIRVGNDLGTGKVQGEIFGYRQDGTQVHWIKSGTDIYYFNGTIWVSVITGLTENAEYVFANYSSLAGTFTYAFGADGIYKLHNANPGSYIAMHVGAPTNYKGLAIIDKGRTLMWNVGNDKTTLYCSYIDAQNTTVYTSVSAEVLGASGATTYTGTLAFKSGSALRSCFSLSVSGTTGAGVETFNDSYNGTLTGSLGGTGTINYLTGVYSVTFNGVVTSGNVTANYQWENSNEKGVTDFRKSTTRIAAEGFKVPQDEGGDPILKVEIGTDGTYYSFKSKSVYSLTIADTDLSYTNQVYRRSIGLQSLRGVVSTGKGIVFMNLANPDDPQMTILKKNPVADNVEPYQLFPHFKFSTYYYDDCSMATYGRFIIVACRTHQSATNDTILLADLTQGSIEALGYNGRTFASDGSSFFMGSSLSKAVYKLFDGFDDETYQIANEWSSKTEDFGVPNLKKFRWLRLRGLIDSNQSFEIYANYDGAGYALIGTVLGSQIYVDEGAGSTIGSNGIGTNYIGGGISTDTIAYPYYASFKVKTPKFRARNLRFKALGYGYVNITSVMDEDVFIYEQRMPNRFRMKQHVSLDGASIDLSTPQF